MSGDDSPLMASEGERACPASLSHGQERDANVCSGKSWEPRYSG